MNDDKIIVCKDCGKDFVFPAHAHGHNDYYNQDSYNFLGYNEPVRCPRCRIKDMKTNTIKSFEEFFKEDMVEEPNKKISK